MLCLQSWIDLEQRNQTPYTQGWRHGGGGGQGGISPPKDFKKGKMEKYGVFSCIKVIKISFSVIFNEEIRALSIRASITILALKRLQLQRALPPYPHQGALPPGPPRFLGPPLTIYPGATPACVLFHNSRPFRTILCLNHESLFCTKHYQQELGHSFRLYWTILGLW